MKPINLLPLGLALSLSAVSAYGQSSGELAALQKRLSELEKKTSRLEAENRQLLDGPIANHVESVADKVKFSLPLKELTLYGDLGLRYQWDNSQNVYYKNAKGELGDDHGEQRSRFRYRLRLSADFKLSDNWFGGVGLSTNQYPDSGFQTYDRGFANQEIYLSKAFVGWNATEWATLILGKQNNPFYSTDLLWDTQVNPSGAVEKIAFHKLFGGGSTKEEVTGYSKDGKAIVSSGSKAVELPWELSFVAGQFVFDDNNAYNDGYKNNRGAYLYVQQLLGTYKFTKDVSASVAPTFLTYNGASARPVNVAPFSAANYTNLDYPALGETAYLRILDIPGDVSFKVFGQKAKLYWDYSYNFDGKKRVEEVYQLNGTPVVLKDAGGKAVTTLEGGRYSAKDNYAYLIGFQVGQNKKKNDWLAYVNYRQVGLAGVDPNLNEGTWGSSRTNLKGWKAGIAYNFTDAVVGSLTYYYSDALRKNLYGGQATEGAKVASLKGSEIIQVDFSVKF